MSDYDVDYFTQINDEEGEQARRLADLLIWKYRPKSIIDVGCATGLYLKPFMERGIRITGVDNAIDAIANEVLQVPPKNILMRDITKQPVGKKADLTICLEVLEHIPAKGAKKAIKHISECSNVVIFSAAQPGQGGVGHINCQPKEYWEKLFGALDFHRDTTDEEYLKIIMASGYHMGWLINNMMVLKRNSKK